jgi:hypothetical protein
VRLSGFISDEQIGLGDVVTRITYAAGIKPCGGCGRRAAALNRWMVSHVEALRANLSQGGRHHGTTRDE